MHRFVVSAVIALASLVAPSRASADLTGVWDFVFVGDLGELTPCTMNLLQTGASVALSPAVPGSLCSTASGSLSGSVLSASGTCLLSPV